MDFQTAANLLNVKWFYCNDRIPSAKVQEYTNALQLTNTPREQIKYTVCTYIANKQIDSGLKLIQTIFSSCPKRANLLGFICFSFLWARLTVDMRAMTGFLNPIAVMGSTLLFQNVRFNLFSTSNH